MTAEEILQQLRLLASLESQVALLRTACGNDDALREQVQRLLSPAERTELARHDLTTIQSASDEVPATGAMPASAVAQPAGFFEGQTVGNYKLLQLIGEGGMGTVYMAEQFEPVRRRVALKVIKPGMGSKGHINGTGLITTNYVRKGPPATLILDLSRLTFPNNTQRAKPRVGE